MALQPTSTVTGTPTPTGSPTGTPTNTPTPQGYYSGPITMDSLSAGVTLPASSFNQRTFYLAVLSNGAVTYATPATIVIDISEDGSFWINGAYTLSTAVSATTTTFINSITATSIQNKFWRIRPKVTPVATGGMIFEMVANYTSIPEKYIKYFRKSKTFCADDPYSEGHGYFVYYKPNGFPDRVVTTWF